MRLRVRQVCVCGTMERLILSAPSIQPYRVTSLHPPGVRVRVCVTIRGSISCSPSNHRLYLPACVCACACVCDDEVDPKAVIRPRAVLNHPCVRVCDVEVDLCAPSNHGCTQSCACACVCVCDVQVDLRPIQPRAVPPACVCVTWRGCICLPSNHCCTQPPACLCACVCVKRVTMVRLTRFRSNPAVPNQPACVCVCVCVCVRDDGLVDLPGAFPSNHGGLYLAPACACACVCVCGTMERLIFRVPIHPRAVPPACVRVCVCVCVCDVPRSSVPSIQPRADQSRVCVCVRDDGEVELPAPEPTTVCTQSPACARVCVCVTMVC
jgi:hypothetical protein